MIIADQHGEFRAHDRAHQRDALQEIILLPQSFPRDVPRDGKRQREQHADADEQDVAWAKGIHGSTLCFCNHSTPMTPTTKMRKAKCVLACKSISAPANPR